jgi:hypothetical protein
VRKPLLDYLNPQFNRDFFPDIFDPLWIAAAVLLVLTVVLYNVRTRQLHRHEPLRTMQEWLLWTGLIVFGLILVSAIFQFRFFVVVGTLLIGVVVFVWIRFFRFPPIIAAYNGQLRRARFFSQARYKSPEATVRARRTRGPRRRR